MHKIILFSVFTAFVLVPNVFGNEYYFDFYVQFNCKHSNFGVNAQFFDKDTMIGNGPDKITKQHIDKSTSGRMNFKEKGMLTGDEMFSEGFDVKMVLTHTCNQNGEEMHSDVHLKPLFRFPKTSYTKYYQYHMVLDITDLTGDRTYEGQLEEN